MLRAVEHEMWRFPYISTISYQWNGRTQTETQPNVVRATRAEPKYVGRKIA